MPAFERSCEKPHSFFLGKGERGHAVVETALIAPWIFFLFVGVLDFGFYAYSLIAVENATRVAALGAGTSNSARTDQTQACTYVREELRHLPNSSSLPTACDALDLIVNVQALTDAEGDDAVRVTVTYRTIPMIPIPGLVTGRLTITRSAETKVFGG